MRRLVCAIGIGALLAVTWSGGTGWAAGVSLTLSSGVTAQKCTTNVNVTMSGGGGTVGGLQADILIPTAVFSLVDPANPCTLAAGRPGQITAGLVNEPPPPAGMQRLKILVFDVSNGAYPDGVLATCKLKVAAAAPTGNATVVIDDAETHPTVVDVQGNELPWGIWRSGTVTVGAATGCCPG